jgi:DNA-directed RNA polymerase subunit RPC12/RpoP
MKELWCQECEDNTEHYIFGGFNGNWFQCQTCSYRFFVTEPPEEEEEEDEDDADLST